MAWFRQCLVLSMLAAPAAAADDLQDAHKTLLGRGDIQFQFETPVAPPPPVDNWLIRAIDAIAPPRPLP